MNSVLFRKYVLLGICIFFIPMVVQTEEKDITKSKIESVLQALDAHDEAQLEKLLSGLSHEQLNWTSLGGLTLMHHVIIDGLEWAVPLLIKAGLDMEVGDKKGNSPLLYALYLKKPELLKLFLKNNASPHLANNYDVTLLHEASAQGDNDTVKMLLAYKADPNRVDNKGRSPLFYASYSGNPDTIKLLMDAGAISSQRDINGEDITHRAAAGGSLPIINVLLEHGVSFSNPDANNDLPVHKALRYGRNNAVKRLLKENYFSDKGDVFGKNALHWLSFYDNDDELFDSVLAKYPYLVNGENVLKQTPLHLAAAFAKEDTVDKLLKAGADSLVEDSQGFLPRDYAIGYGKAANQKLIEQASKKSRDL